VVTTTFPNVAQFIPLGRLVSGRLVSGRLARINAAIRSPADRHGFRLVDLQNAASMRELDTWAVDRVRASARGHMLFAALPVQGRRGPQFA
jgi:hypothetical protein